MLVPHTYFALEDSLPMEDDDRLSSAGFTWAIENFSKLNTKELFSPVFNVGGYNWRVLMFPKGNNFDQLSIYLDAADSSWLPNGWSVYAELSLTVVNQYNANCNVMKDTQHIFYAKESDWGFTSFMPLSELYDPYRGYLRDDTCIVEAHVAVHRTVTHDSKKVVRFRSLEKPNEDEFSLELSELHSYDDVVDRVTHLLGLDDPSKIRLTSNDCYSQQPKPQPIKYRGVGYLLDMLVDNNQTSDILYYEVLDIPLPELQDLETYKVAFHHATKDEVVIHTIRLAKESTVRDVISDLRAKVKLSHPKAEVRLLAIFHHRIYKIFTLDEKIENIYDQYWTLRAEEIPEEEKEIGPQDLLIHVDHFKKDTTQIQIQHFGEPFVLVIHEGETLADIKLRVQKKLQVPDEDFSMWKFAFFSLGQPEYLQESDVLSTRFQRRDAYGAWPQYLGLEHSDNPPKRSHSPNQVHELALGHEAQVIEASAETEGHNTVEKKGIACICTSSGLKTIINLEDSAPPVDDPESWRGFPVGKDHASLLREAEVEHPDFFNDVKYSSSRRAIQSLNLFASNLANLASDKWEQLSKDDLRIMRDELSDLECDGFNIRWAIESVDRVLILRFQIPLQQEIDDLTADSTYLHGEIWNLQQKKARLKEEVTTLKEKIECAEKEQAAVEKDMEEAELLMKDIASELETHRGLLAEYNKLFSRDRVM